jgi:hypothetical protein
MENAPAGIKKGKHISPDGVQDEGLHMNATGIYAFGSVDFRF